MSRLRPSHLLAVLLAGLVGAAAPAATTAAPLQGTAAIDGSPYAVTPVGDVNGDGFDDLGAVGGIVLWGDANPAPVNLGGDLGSRAATFPVAGGNWLPTQLGDLDSDGYDDFALGASTGAKGGYIVYGAPGRTGIPVTPGPRVSFIKSGYSEAQLQGLGDFNGDGFDDILANRSTATNTNSALRGGATVVLGGPRVATIDANVAGSRTMVINGSTSCKITWLIFVPIGYNCMVAFSPATGIGDFDGDGKTDLSYDTLRDDGRFILLGRAAATGTITANAPTGGFIKVKPFAGSEYAGSYWRPEPAGDVNGDGKADVIVPRYGGGLSDHAVYLGRTGLTGAALDTGQPSFVVNVGNLSQVARVGDTSGDGVDDLGVAHRTRSPHGNVDTYDFGLLEGLQSAGAGSVIQPTAAMAVPGLPLSRWGDYSRINVVRGAGDVDGDGRADLVLPADGARTILATRGTDRVAPELTVDRSGGVIVGPFASVEPSPLVPGPSAGSITVTLQEAATVAFAVTSASGQTVGSFERSMPKWQSQFAWDGKLAGQALAPGTYALAMTPRDAAGNVGATRTIEFTVAAEGGAQPATLAVKVDLRLPNGTAVAGKADVYLRCPDELVSLMGVAAGTTVAVGGEARFAGDVCALAGYAPPTGVTGVANCQWQTVSDLNGVPLGSNGQAGPLAAGANVLTKTYTCTGGIPVDVLPPERFGSGKWKAYGSANIVSGYETLTLTSRANESGALVWPEPIDPNGWEYVMSSTSNGGNGQAEGVAMSFIPATSALPAPGPTPLGGAGGGLGIGGVPATTVALDAFRNPGDPAAAFVGIAESSTASKLNYVASADPGVRLRGSNVALKVAYNDGVLSVYVNYKLRLRRTMTLPSRAYLAISGSTGSIFQTQLIGGFNVGPYTGY